jgi:CubicO group peptidase (beta-lactamase class C family)
MHLRIFARLSLALVMLATVLAAPVSSDAQVDPATRDYWPTDDWRTASPESMGMDAALLMAADQRIRTETPLLSSMVVVRDGHIVFEGYYNGQQVDQPYYIWSVTKSITSIAVGIALQEGVLTGLDQTLGELIPERIPVGADPRVYGITIEQLLTMTAGWQWDGRINFSLTHVTDDLDAMLTRPMVCDPGACFEYDSGPSNLLAYIIQHQTGELIADYLGPRLFEPLGIENYEWVTTEYGASRGGGGLIVTPRDLAKLGYLYLNQGVWDGQQIVDPAWVEASTTWKSSGVNTLSGANIGYGASYGYHWWVTSIAGFPAYMGLGYGGQMLYVVPGLDLVVVTGVASTDASTPQNQQNVFPIVEQLVVQSALPG